MTFKQAEKTLREKHNVALVFGPTGSVDGRPRWFTVTETGVVTAEGRSWRDAFSNATKQGSGDAA